MSDEKDGAKVDEVTAKVTAEPTKSLESSKNPSESVQGQPKKGKKERERRDRQLHTVRSKANGDLIKENIRLKKRVSELEGELNRIKDRNSGTTKANITRNMDKVMRRIKDSK